LVLIRVRGIQCVGLFQRRRDNHPSGNKIMEIFAASLKTKDCDPVYGSWIRLDRGLPASLMRFLHGYDGVQRVSVYQCCTAGVSHWPVSAMLFCYRDMAVSHVLSWRRHLLLTPAGAVGGNTIWLPSFGEGRGLDGSILAGFISEFAFATILAVVSGWLIAGAASAANDLVVGPCRRQPAR